MVLDSWMGLWKLFDLQESSPPLRKKVRDRSCHDDVVFSLI